MADDLDAENDRLNTLWRSEYQAAFVAYAMSRRWDRENAEVWASEIVEDALIAYRGVPPTTAAQADVVECERESA